MQNVGIYNSRIGALKFDGYRITLGENISGKPTATVFKLITTGENKNTWRRVEGFYFNSEIRRDEWISIKIASLKQRVADETRRLDLKKKAMETVIHPYQVGDIIYDSWGYDQTNIDFYEVVELKPKSMVIQAIGSTLVPSEGYGPDAGKVIPDPSERGKKEFKPVIASVYNNSVTYRIRSRHGSFSKYEKGDAGIYCSWGH